MNGNNFNIPVEKKRVLVSPLDWGLGHATRCIPIIKELQQLGCTVLIAADGAPKKLLEEAFPGLRFIPLDGYHVRYSKTKRGMGFRLITQLPKLVSRIYTEHRWLKRAIKKYRLNAVISDNRYGLYSKKIPCVFITHQLLIQTGNHFTDHIAQRINYFFINKFSRCWIPDEAAEGNLAGVLAHPVKMPRIKTAYLGVLSRFMPMDLPMQQDLAILLSGPEPQRSIFENILLEQLKNTQQKVSLVRGLPGEITLPHCHNNLVHIYNHLDTEALNKLLVQSALVLCRSGYTSIMDLAQLQKKAILVPTPGQTEQEYLARRSFEKKFFFATPQEDFNLKYTLEEIKAFSFAPLPTVNRAYKKVVQDFIKDQQER